MAHMVIFETPEGSSGYNQFETLDAAVAFVEQLRNEQEVAIARIFELEEVKFAFKPYYRVELAALEAGPQPSSASTAPPSPAAAPAAAPAAPPASGPLAGSTPPAAPARGPEAVAATAAPAPSVATPPVALAEDDLSMPVGAPPQGSSSPLAADADDQPPRRGLFGR